ncbi:hypothetical protein V3M69_00990 [Trueperella pyogenes]|uniref:hypothetical protein n=1 Tax=Trueperella pyogenes TaxID=1661 RepID=UPI00345DC5FF
MASLINIFECATDKNIRNRVKCAAALAHADTNLDAWVERNIWAIAANGSISKAWESSVASRPIYQERGADPAVVTDEDLTFCVEVQIKEEKAVSHGDS